MIGYIEKFLENITPYRWGIACLITIGIMVLITIVFILWCYQKDKKRNLQVQYERKFYQFITKNHSDIYMLIRVSDLYAEYITDNIEQILGLNREEVRIDIETLHQCVDKMASKQFQEAFQEWDRGSDLELDFQFMPISSDEVRWGHFLLSLTEDGQYYVVVIRDISKQQEWKENIEKELEVAYQENESKTSFLSKMSHEIRTPMNGILGMIALARMNITKPKESDDYLVKAESLSQFLLTLINDVLDMSRIESGKVELEQVRYDLFGVADKLKAMFARNIEEKGICFKIEMQDFDIRYVVGDELRLTQVIINFISNAQKFTPSGGNITITFRQMNKIEGKVHLMIRVRDTGKGMSPEFLTRIFKPFEQESATVTKTYGGTGLGMAISDNLIHLMGGQIVIDSEIGKGSDFTIYIALPIAEGVQDLPLPEEETGSESQSQEVAEESAEPASVMEGLHILMAEDNEINAEITVTMLELLGAEMTATYDGEEVVQKFMESEEGYYDVILMDIQMPKRDGWEAAKVIRELDRKDAGSVLIFALSANAFVEDKRHSIEVGMNDHISKPIDFDLLSKKITEQFHAKRTDR